ncbi:glycosyltransferase [Pseudoalteromonas sp. NZS127_1]|uniref:glycosyltransferase n=1 Tax=Pseudoalteromonas sp. NZS127_1 TaxID=2792074 RepID=UPI0018CD715C|nr:glycosyltransferase [Pseudoalteromonas sp. NZS127_1]MBG9994699.1 glycosyltransferase [Pseudoalteromonas sp. NZS127_1]
MRIAVFSNSFPVLSETFIINQIVGLIKLGAKVDIISNETVSPKIMHSSVLEYSLLDKLRCIGIGSKKNKTHKVFISLLNSITLVFTGRLKLLINVFFDKYLTVTQKLNLISALKLLKNEKLIYDNVICHFGVNGYYLCKMRELGILEGRISTVFHGYEVSDYNVINKYLPQYKQLFIRGDLMLPISELWKELLINWGCDEKKILVHRMGIDVNDFEFRNPSTPFSHALKVIQVGRLTDKKAILDSINAVVLASKRIKIEFIIIGDGELYLQAKRLIASLEASSYIRLLGQQPQSVVKQYLNDADVFLLPSVKAASGDMEGIPVALMEAMAKGLITLSTYHSGIPELIKHSVTGFLVNEHDINGLVNCLLNFQSLSKEDIIDIRTRAREICLTKYNNNTLNSDLLNIAHL